MRAALKIIFYFVLSRYFYPRSVGSLKSLQDRKLTQAFSRLSSHFEFFRNKNPSALESILLMNRQIVNQNFGALNSAGISLEVARNAAETLEKDQKSLALPPGICPGLSSGTSGERGVFLTSESERLRWAGFILAKALPRSFWKFRRIALSLRSNNLLYESLGTSRWIDLRYFNPGTNRLSELAQAMAEFDPDILVAPPAVLLYLADFAPKSFRPKFIFSVADFIDADERNTLAQRFGAPVREIYQATEGFLAITCEHGGLHLNEEIAVFEKEWIDDEGRFLPVVTDLQRTTQAIVRYRMSDVLMACGLQCTCGSPTQLLTRIEGRADEVFLLKSNKNQVRIFQTDLWKEIGSHCPDRHSPFQLIQKEETKFELFVSGSLEPWKPFVESFKELCLQKSADAAVTVEILSGFSRSLEQKRRRFVRSFPDPRGVL